MAGMEPRFARAYTICDSHGGPVPYDEIRKWPVPPGIVMRHGSQNGDVNPRRNMSVLLLCAECAARLDEEVRAESR